MVSGHRRLCGDRGVRSIVSRRCAMRRSNEDSPRVSMLAAARSPPLALRGMPSHPHAASAERSQSERRPHICAGLSHRPQLWQASEQRQTEQTCCVVRGSSTLYTVRCIAV